MALNSQQEKLAHATLTEPIVGVAGAGTGKTTAIMARAKYALEHIPGGQVILVTFTRLAAQEMRNRLSKLVTPQQISRTQIGTFHAILANLIRHHAASVGLTENFTILSESSSNILYREAIKNLTGPTQFAQLLSEEAREKILKDHPDQQYISDFDFLRYFFGDTYNLTAKDKHTLTSAERQKKIAEQSGKDISRKNYKLIITMISKMINTASAGELNDGKFKKETLWRLWSQVAGNVFYLLGDTDHPYEFSNPEKDNYFASLVSVFYKAFLKSLKLAIETNTVNYDQILFIGYLMARKNDENKTLIDSFKHTVAYVIVDEYQDTNYLQDTFINAICDGNLTVVGDIDQAIYEFRGGTTKLLKERAEHARKINPNNVINLTANYRSYQPILDCANSVIDSNLEGRDIRKPLEARRERDEYYFGVTHVKAVGSSDQTKDILKAIEYYHDTYDMPYNKMAILARSRISIAPFLASLSHFKTNIEFNDLTNSADILNSDPVIDTLNYLKILVNPKDLYAFLAIIDRPKRGIGDKAIQLLINLASQNKQSLIEFVLSDNIKQLKDIGKRSLYKKINDFSKVYRDLISADRKHLAKGAEDGHYLTHVLNTLLTQTGYLDWISNLKNGDKLTEYLGVLFDLADDFEDRFNQSHDAVSIIDLANNFLMDLDEQAATENENGVVINTIHGAKGLEYVVVFLIGMNEPIFPSNRAIKSEELESERRLMYVAVTRARNGLRLYSTDTVFGNPAIPSRFLAEMGDINELETPGKERKIF